MKELISIVIPVYNALPYLEECLASATSQSYSNLEIIVINDGSTDASEGVARKFAEADKRIKLHSQENQGLGYTRNRGIRISSGNYIFFLDADDAIPKNAISSLATAIARNDADYAVGKVVRFNESRMYVPIRHLNLTCTSKQGW
ncbi:glycosyltransferase family 2 protein [Planococcus glaciei]|nr:glycosyltransferase family 2 protein [Planococcus glaciei]QDY44750.1 glycosyltransferase family 2 protein [Planococcus glaciei]